jgi:ATP synthase protein I
MDDPTETGAEDRDANDLAARIEAAETALKRRREAPMREVPEAVSMTRVGADFVGAVLGGGVTGWGVDWAFGTRPWGLLVCVLAGFASGIMGVVRAFDRGDRGSGMGK